MAKKYMQLNKITVLGPHYDHMRNTTGSHQNHIWNKSADIPGSPRTADARPRSGPGNRAPAFRMTLVSKNKLPQISIIYVVCRSL